MEEEGEGDEEELVARAEVGEVQGLVEDDEEVDEGEGADELLALGAGLGRRYTAKSLPLQQLRLPPSQTS